MSNHIPKKEVFIQLGNEKSFQLKSGKTIKLENGHTIQLENGKTIKLANGKSIQMGKPIQVPAPGTIPKERIVGAPVQLREENVQEILTSIPHWMIRWGNTLFLSLIVLLLAISWYIKYPDVIPTTAIVLNKYPVQKVFLSENAKVSKILVEKEEAVNEATPLLVLENSANYQDILKLISAINESQINSQSFYFPMENLPPLSLGDLQSKYAQFEESYYQYLIHKEKIGQSRKQVYGQQNGSTNNISQTNPLSFFKKAIEDFYQLKSSVAIWKQDYLVLSSLSGLVKEINTGIDNNDNQEQQIMTIQPSLSADYYALLQVPFRNSGKIKVSQQVNIKLENYPEMEFGMLQGTITSISESKDQENAYIVEVSLPQQLTTSYHKEIVYTNSLVGTGEIITNKRRLLARLVPLSLSF